MSTLRDDLRDAIRLLVTSTGLAIMVVRDAQ
jgi:hypothetical protein